MFKAHVPPGTFGQALPGTQALPFAFLLKNISYDQILPYLNQVVSQTVTFMPSQPPHPKDSSSVNYFP